MTDKEKVERFLAEFDIPFSVEVSPEEKQQKFIIDAGSDNKKVLGYCGFFLDFCFDGEGKFLNMGVWE